MKTTKKERQGWPYVSHELYIGLANSCLCLVSTKSSHFIPCYHPVRCLVSLFSLKWNSKHSMWVNIKKRSVDGCSLKVLAASPFINCHSDAHFAPNMNLSGIFLWESPLGRLCSLYWGEARGEGRGWGETVETRRGTVRYELPGAQRHFDERPSWREVNLWLFYHPRSARTDDILS